jgi:small subunit ribosomal protein S4
VLFRSKDSFKQSVPIIGATQSKEREVPEYIVADHKKMTAKFNKVPKYDQIPYPVQMEPKLVVEYYSR